MDAIILEKRNENAEKLARELGFTKTYFTEDVVLLTSKSKKELSRGCTKNSKKLKIYRPPTEELLRYALERTSVDMLAGVELINPKDSVHFVRGGLDQIYCKLAAQKGKMIGFSFSDILRSKNKGKLLGRIMLNIKLCRKYNVETHFGVFSSSQELRSTQDLFSFWKVLGGTSKKVFRLSR